MLRVVASHPRVSISINVPVTRQYHKDVLLHSVARLFMFNIYYITSEKRVDNGLR